MGKNFNVITTLLTCSRKKASVLYHFGLVSLDFLNILERSKFDKCFLFIFLSTIKFVSNPFSLIF